MEKGIIITLPRHDDVTSYISQFSFSIEEEANQKRINIKKIKDSDANRKYFEEVLKKLNYKMVVFNGHGSDKTICGHKNEVIIESGINDSILRERIIYARSCNAASILGRECMKNNKIGCFIGYELPFMFYIDTRWTSNPRKDNVAPIFLEPSNLVPISLIKGNTAIQAHENSRKQILKNINKIIKTNDKDSLLFAEALWNNYIGQIIIGNESVIL